MSYYLRRHKGLSGPFDPILDRLNAIVKDQIDKGLDAAGDRADRYLDSPKGQALLDKFEEKVETALVNVAYKRRWELMLTGISLAALTVVGVSLGAKVGKTGVRAAAGISLLAALPLLLAKNPEEQEGLPVPDKKKPLPKKKIPPKKK